MLFKGFRSNRSPLATFVVIAYIAALFPRTAFAEPRDESSAAARAQNVSEQRGTPPGFEEGSGESTKSSTTTSRTQLDLSSAVAPSSGPQDTPPPPPPSAPPADSDPRAGGETPIGGQSIALPSGAGSVAGLGEGFASDPSTGVGSQVVPIPLIPVRSGVQPTLALAYNSGGGNSVAGFGWNTGAPYIARQTDRGIPNYDDRASYYANQDRFVFNGSEIVPLGVVQSGKAPAAPSEIMPAWSEGWQYFRERTEESYNRFFWSPSHRTWRVQAGQGGNTFEFGVPLGGLVDDNALETATEGDPTRVFRWNIARAYDANGDGKPAEDAQPKPYNVIVYRYAHDNGIAYLSDIYDTPPVDTKAFAALSAFAHHTHLVWEARPDTLSNYRRGWRVEQRLRLHGIDIASKTYTGAAAARRQLRRVHLGYDPVSHISLLLSATLEGRCDGDESSALVPVEDGSEHLAETTGCAMMPPTSFSYSHVTSSSPIATAAGFEPFDGAMHDAVGSPLLGLDSSLGVMLVDMNGDGLPDVLDGDSGRNAGQHRIFFNGAGGQAGAFGAPTMAPFTPVTLTGGGRIDGFDMSLKGGNVIPLDFDADGTLDLVYFKRLRTPVVFSPLVQAGSATWQAQAAPADSSAQGPDLEIASKHQYTRVTDVNGDGLVDIVTSTGTELLTYLSLAGYPGGQGAFGSGARTGASQASLSGQALHACLPASNGVVAFDDPRVQLADMNADGLVDIVRLKRGHFEYWPGRGDGHWGTGDLHACTAAQFAPPIVMDNSPFPTVADEEVRYGDVNGDGLSDAIAVEGTAVVTWLNIDGARWSAPITIPKGPFVGTAKNTTQITDLNGSGTPDIVFGDAGHYRYIDLSGGKRPLLLIGTDNGFGKSTTVEYTTSTDEMLRASTTSTAWVSTAPSALPLVKRITVSDNLDRIQRKAHAYVTSYDYSDPFYDRRGPSFRGFRTTVTNEPGGADAVGRHTRTHFHVGECVDEDVPGRCARRDLENPRDAMRGLARDAEVFDDAGNYVTTKHTTYRLRNLFSGLDGREVRAVFVSASDTYGYETSPFASDEKPASVVDVERELTPGQVSSESATVLLRSTAGRVHTRSEVTVDALGHNVETRDLGCIEGCPAQDETVVHHTIFDRVPGDGSGWFYRPSETFTTGSRATAARHHLLYTYDGFGQLTQTSAVLEGSLPLLRAHASGKAVAPAPAAASKDATVVLSSKGYDAFGHAVDVRSAGYRCATKSYDAAFGELPVLEVISAGPLGANGCGTRQLVTTGIYDRGAQVATSKVGYNGERGLAQLDSFGRLLREFEPDPFAVGSVSPLASKEYIYVAPAAGTPVVRIGTRTHRGATRTDPTYVESWSFTDSLGRSLARLLPADKSKGDGGDWLVQGASDYDSRNQVIRAYAPWFWDGDPAQFNFGNPPKTPYEAREYDGFGRVVVRRAVDGSVVERAVYHPLATEHWDAGDLATGGSHAGTYVTGELDGHGRTVRKIERLYAEGALQSIETRAEYLPSDEVARIVRARIGSTDAPIVRWMRYDSLGRLVLNAEPNTTLGFMADPPADVSALHAWRYAYDDAGDLVGTSDARGCGANYAYDTAGRIVAEDRSPCLDSQPDYSPPDLTTGEGTEVFHRYDEADPDVHMFAQSSSKSAGGGAPSDAGAASTADDMQRCPAPLDNWLGRSASVSTLGAKGIKIVDGRGRAVCGATRIALPGAPASSLGDRYAARWYVKRLDYDAADRVTAATTGARSAELLGSDGKSVLRAEYTRRGGDVYSVNGSYGTLLTSRTRDALGLAQSVTYGDLAGTTTGYAYDARHRLSAVQTVRNRPALWSGASGPYVPNTSTTEPTLQTVLEDGQFFYDESDNPVEIRDNRDPAQWPVGARPVTRKITYDDLNRATRVQYVYAGGSDPWQSPYAAELQAAAQGQTPKVSPSPHVSFANRILEERYTYDWRGNITQSTDDASGFYDRSLGKQEHGTATAGPYQLLSASNRATSGDHAGDLTARYDEAGNLAGMVVRRDGPCLPTTASCWQRFAYDWTEVGELARARRWDLSTAERATLGDASAALPVRAPDAELRYTYATGGTRVLKTAVDQAGAQRHDAYIFDTLELRHARFDTSTGDYELTPATEAVYLAVAGTRVGRVDYAEHDVPTVQSGHQHVFLELRDHLGSSSIVIDKDTSELVERTTYTAYGQSESDYRPARWDNFREPYRFTGKEDDTELGLIYIGKRYYAPALHRWISPDPLALHSPGATDLNVYAYVHGQVFVAVDPDGQIFWFAIIIAIVIAMAVDAAIQGYKMAKGQQKDFNWAHMFITGAIAGAAAATGLGAGALAESAEWSSLSVDAAENVAEGAAGSALSNAYDQLQDIHEHGGTFKFDIMLECGFVGGFSGLVGTGVEKGLLKGTFPKMPSGLAAGGGGFANGLMNSVGTSIVDGSYKDKSIWEHLLNGAGNAGQEMTKDWLKPEELNIITSGDNDAEQSVDRIQQSSQGQTEGPKPSETPPVGGNNGANGPQSAAGQGEPSATQSGGTSGNGDAKQPVGVLGTQPGAGSGNAGGADAPKAPQTWGASPSSGSGGDLGGARPPCLQTEDVGFGNRRHGFGFDF